MDVPIVVFTFLDMTQIQLFANKLVLINFQININISHVLANILNYYKLFMISQKCKRIKSFIYCLSINLHCVRIEITQERILASISSEGAKIERTNSKPRCPDKRERVCLFSILSSLVKLSYYRAQTKKSVNPAPSSVTYTLAGAFFLSHTQFSVSSNHLQANFNYSI